MSTRDEKRKSKSKLLIGATGTTKVMSFGAVVLVSSC